MNTLPGNDWLLDEAGPGAVQRGADYYLDGRVRLTGGDDDSFTAEARGSEVYALELACDEDGWRWHCDCPAAADGAFCKHLVAAVLVARDRAGASPAPVVGRPAGRSRRQQGPAKGDELREFLASQPAATLVDWLHELAMADRGVTKRLLLRRASQQPDALKTALGLLLSTGGFLDYRGAIRYAEQLGGGIVQLRELLARDPAACRTLCEYAFKRLIKAIARADDSAGSIGECLGDIADLHQQACAAAPTGKGLAKTLHELKSLDEWGLLPLAGYWDALGADGQRDYANRVLVQFEALPPSTAQNRYGEAFAVCRRVEELAQCSGDFELLQRVLRRDLSEPHQHLRVYDSLQEAGREREALAWIELAVKRFPRAAQLRQSLAESLAGVGMREEALEQAWQCFCASPDDEAWLRLRRLAGPREWPDWRVRALDTVAAAERGVLHRRIDLLRLDGDIDTALQLARDNPVALASLLELASGIQRTHPADAGALYLRAVRATADHLNGAGGYQRITHYLREAASLLPAAQWQPVLAGLREQHRRKRKLMEMLDTVRPD